MSQFDIQLDGNAVADAVRKHVEQSLGMDLTGKTVNVNFSQGRKTPQNPNPKATATVSIIDYATNIKPEAAPVVEEAKSAETPVVEEPKAEVTEEVTEVAEEVEDDLDLDSTPADVDENGVKIEEDDLPLTETEETAIADEDDLFGDS